jgi:hypothetical protein
MDPDLLRIDLHTNQPGQPRWWVIHPKPLSFATRWANRRISSVDTSMCHRVCTSWFETLLLFPSDEILALECCKKKTFNFFDEVEVFAKKKKKSEQVDFAHVLKSRDADFGRVVILSFFFSKFQTQ